MTTTEQRRGTGWASALSVGTFRWVWAAVFGANSGMYALSMVGGMVAYDLSHGSTLWSSAMMTATMVPSVVGSPITGVLADRYRRTALMTAGTLAGVLGAGIAAAGYLLGAGLYPMLVGCIVAGLARSLLSPSWQALIPSVLRPGELLGAGALMRVAMQGGEFAGPAVATAVVAFGGTSAGFAVAIAWYLASVLLTVPLRRVHADGRVAQQHRPLLGPIVDGARYVATGRPLGPTVLLVGLHCALTMAFLGLLPSLAARTLHRSGLYGTLLTEVGLGAILGSLALAVVARRLDVTRVLVGTAVASGLSLVVLAVPTPLGAQAGAILAGASQAAFMAAAYTVTQQLARVDMRGRVAAVSNIINSAGMSFISMLWGAIAAPFGAPAVLVATGLAFVLVTAGFLWRLPGLRRRAGLAAVAVG